MEWLIGEETPQELHKVQCSETGLLISSVAPSPPDNGADTKILGFLKQSPEEITGQCRFVPEDVEKVKALLNRMPTGGLAQVLREWRG